MSARGIVALIALSSMVAGCIGAGDVKQLPTESVAELPAHTHVVAPNPDLVFRGTDCEEGGFVAAYVVTGEKMQGTWNWADVTEEIGRPTHDGLGVPAVGPMDGHWHMGIHCASVDRAGNVSKDFDFGWVGYMVKPPAWDPGGADLHFLLSGFAVENGTIADAFRNVTTADVTHAYMINADWLAPRDLPRSAVYTVFADVERGVYESWSNMGFYRDVPDRVVRLWWEVPASGEDAGSGHTHTTGAQPGTFHPVYWDLHTSGAKQYVTPAADQAELGAHNKMEMEHASPAQPTVTNIYEHTGLTFDYGAVVTNVTLDTVWTH